MSQNLRNQPGDSQGNSGRGLHDRQESKNYEGFEGMNYEQRRQPYDPQHTANGNSGDSRDSSQRRDEP